MGLANAETAVDDRRLALRGVGIILVSSLLFGAMAVCVRVAAREMPSQQIAFFRLSGSLLLLLLFARGRALRPKPGNVSRVLLRGLLGCSAISCYFFAIQEIGAGLATLLHCTYPVPTALLAVLISDERMSGKLMAAVALNLLGILIVVGPSANLAAASPSGVLSALLASVLAGGAVTTARHLRASEDASLITIYFMLVGTIIAAPALFGGIGTLSGGLVLALSGVVVTSAAGQWLLHHGLGYTSAAQGSLACATSVLTAAVLSAVFLHEGLQPTVLLGACLMIGAVGLAAVGGPPLRRSATADLSVLKV